MGYWGICALLYIVHVGYAVCPHTASNSIGVYNLTPIPQKPWPANQLPVLADNIISKSEHVEMDNNCPIQNNQVRLHGIFHPKWSLWFYPLKHQEETI